VKNRLRFIFLALFFVSFCFSSYAAQGIINAPKTAPLFQLKSLDDKIVSLTDYLGKKSVVLVFWTTWCPYCREQLKQLNGKLPALTKAGIEILAINVGEPKNKVADFTKSRSLNLRILLDQDNNVSNTYELMGVPTYFVIDISGQIVAIGNQFPEDAINQLAVK